MFRSKKSGMYCKQLGSCYKFPAVTKALKKLGPFHVHFLNLQEKNLVLESEEIELPC